MRETRSRFERDTWAAKRSRFDAGDDLTDRDADDEHEHRGLDVFGAVDAQGVVGPGEEEVEGERGLDRRDRPDDAAAEGRGHQDHDGEQQRDVGRGDVVAQRDERRRHPDRQDERALSQATTARAPGSGGLGRRIGSGHGRQSDVPGSRSHAEGRR